MFKIFVLFMFLINIAYAQDVGLEIEIPTDDSSGFDKPIDSSNVVDSSQLDSYQLDSSQSEIKMPELMKFIEADYPDYIVKKGIEGNVILDILISDSGKVDSVGVVGGVNIVLDSLAKKAVEKFVFKPAKMDSVNIPVILRYSYNFSIKSVLEKIKEYVNFEGLLIERGTRKTISDATISITFLDTTADSTINVPFFKYLNKISSYSGQELEENNLIGYSNDKGTFRFKSLPCGKLKIKVIANGYKPFVDIITIEKNQLKNVKFYLTRDSYNEYEIVTYGKKERKEVSKRTLKLSEIKKLPGVGGDAIKVIQTMPGVARPSFISGAIALRGASTDDSKFYLDGISLPKLYHFGGLKSVYNSEALDRIDFYPGGFNSRYGDAIAGIVELHSRRPNTEAFHGYVDVNLLDASFMVEGPITDKISTLLTARRSYLDKIIQVVYDNVDLNLPMTILPYYWDYVSKTTFKLSKNNKIDLTLFGSLDNIDVLLANSINSSTEISEQTDRFKSMDYFHTATLNWDYRLDSLNNICTFQIEKDRTETSAFGFFAMDQDGYSFSFRDQATYKFNPKLTLNTGTECDVYNVSYNIGTMGFDGLIVRDTVDNKPFFVPSLYANVEYKPTKNLLVIPGMRIDYYNFLKYDGSYVPEFYNYKTEYSMGIPADISARMTFRYKWNKKNFFKGAVGSYNEAPRPYGLSTDTAYGNPELKTTKSSQFVLGNETNISDLDFLDVQVYYNNIWDMSRQTSESDYENSPNPNLVPPYLDNGKGRSYGIELYLKHNQSKHFMGWISYTLSRSERWNFAENKWALFNLDQTHNFQFLGSWLLPQNWSVGTRVRYTTGNPETPVIGTNYIEDQNSYESLYGEYLSSRVDPFFQVDLRVDKKIIFKEFIFSYYLDIQNASYFLYKSPEDYVYNYDRTERDVVSSIIYPSIGFKIKF